MQAGKPTEVEKPKVDVWERTKGHNAPVQSMNRRLFMQLMVFDVSAGEVLDEVLDSMETALSHAGVDAVLYEDMNNPRSVGLLTWSENPEHFVLRVRPALNSKKLSHQLTLKPDFTMIGRTYSTGYEPSLEFWLINRPIETALNQDWRWAVWYPLRRSGAFAQLEPREQGTILREHAEIGRSYGEQDLAHDIRLACHGLDEKDNEFVIGLVGKELHPLSHVVQRMRSTRQTSEYISQMGPFFIGHAARWVSQSTEKPGS